MHSRTRPTSEIYIQSPLRFSDADTGHRPNALLANSALQHPIVDPGEYSTNGSGINGLAGATGGAQSAAAAAVGTGGSSILGPVPLFSQVQQKQQHLLNPPQQPDRVTDKWIADLEFYQKTLDEMASVKIDEEFQDELLAVQQWFSIISEGERTAALYTLLGQSNQVQVRFFITYLQNMAKNDTLSGVLSPSIPEFASQQHFTQQQQQQQPLKIPSQPQPSTAPSSTASSSASSSFHPHHQHHHSLNASFPSKYQMTSDYRSNRFSSPPIPLQDNSLSQQYQTPLSHHKHSYSQTFSSNNTSAAVASAVAAAAAAASGSTTPTPTTYSQPPDLISSMGPSHYQQVKHPVTTAAPVAIRNTPWAAAREEINRPKSADVTMSRLGFQSNNSNSNINKNNINTSRSRLNASSSSPTGSPDDDSWPDMDFGSKQLRKPQRTGSSQFDDDKKASRRKDETNFVRPIPLHPDEQQKQPQPQQQSGTTISLSAAPSPSPTPNSYKFPKDDTKDAAAQPSPSSTSTSATSTSTTTSTTTTTTSAATTASGPLTSASPVPPAGSASPEKSNEAYLHLALLEDINAWLKALRLHKYKEALGDLHWRELIMLTDEDLINRGVQALGARRKMLKVFETIKQAESAGTLS